MYYFQSSVYEPPVFPHPLVVFKEVEVEVVKPKSGLFLAAKVFLFAAILILFISYFPSIYYFVKANIFDNNLATQNNSLLLSNVNNLAYQPSFDKDLPLENKLIIPAIKIDTVINEAKDDQYEDALKVGVWRVNDFGTPYDRSAPTILAAHRYGYLNWSIDFRLHESFYNLPKLSVGDTVTIIWRQRKYVYAVFKSEEDTKFHDYKADLILYTCRDLTGDIREIKYARLIVI